MLLESLGVALYDTYLTPEFSMTQLEATYLFDAAVYRVFTADVQALLDAPDGSDELKANAQMLMDHWMDCKSDLDACTPDLPVDHTIFKDFDLCLDSYWLTNCKRLQKQFA